ncbi:p21-C-terminal region-binding protein-domain-containing protein [Kockovaella imperatae]|uniref:p21-C-terminal region-binding protein-domain-containing protein n=1 Tax=Kockovaella imperatae TaxID=4999 RepID=A0A1Y1U5Y1_9TREE|nr:p21-C-terminal region-binding protein-domain-containing protein [Kockovaella imperatae]ORX33440.1 p21-C-terminal region-binding protein-domain-containing protein [Kockovaella imperatae]
MINVDFDFYNLNEDVDQIAAKRLLRQHLSHDEELVDVHPLASLILAESSRLGAGSSIKTDGEESDPWAILAAVDLDRNKDDPALKPFVSYLAGRSKSATSISSQLLEPSKTALIFSLRMLNLPLPLIPPMYKMLLSELTDNGAEFDHFILWGRGYRLEGSEEGMGLDLHDQSRGKKKKKAGKATSSAPALAAGSFAYHPEEEFIDKVAEEVHTYPFQSAQQRDEDAFGVEQFGRLVLVNRDKLLSAIKSMEAAAAEP